MDTAVGSVTYPWEVAEVAVAGIESTGMPLAVAWLGRTSTDDQQDPDSFAAPPAP